MLQFNPSCLKFNIRNKFDFNKLFRMGVNYRKIKGEKEEVVSLIEQRVDAIMDNEKNGTRKFLVPKG